ncbi:MAG: hypothetical protein QOI73_2835 [Solirubrobacteraceae bacterium]|nr:hypothetical protein [Solirubrobacteraceae bacterium]
MLTIVSRCRLLLTGAVAVATSALLAAPAMAANAPVAAASGCPDTAVSQPFAPWGDGSDYFLIPGGAIDRGASEWTLGAGAAQVNGDEPFGVVGGPGHKSLALAAGSSATSAPFCVSAAHRTMRFLADAASSSSLDVDVLYSDAEGVSRSMRIGQIAGAGAWAPTPIVPMVVNELAPAAGMSVRLRFAPRGAGSWTIDDVLVDPYRTR